MNRLSTAAAALMMLPLAGGAVAQATNDNPLSDPRVRKAIAYAIDMDTVVDTLLEGKAVRANGLLPIDSLKPDDLDPYDYDPEKARDLLEEAGWDESRELDIVYYYDDQITSDFMAAVQAYLADVGIKASYRLLEGDVSAQISETPEDPVEGPASVNWDMLYGARAALVPQEYFNRFGKGLMPTIPNVPEMNELVDKVNSTTDPEAQAEGFRQMEEIVNENAYIIPLYYQQLYIVESDRLDRHGNPYGNAQYNYNWGVEEWTIEPNEDGEKVMYTNNAPKQFFELPWKNLGIFVHTRFAFDTILEADGSLSVIGGEMADSYDVSEDGKTFTFTLRDGLTWHDGEPITVDDVVWSIETALQVPVAHPVIATSFRRIEGAQALLDGEADSLSGITTDGREVTIRYAEIDPNVLLTFSQFQPLPKSYFEDVDPVQIQEADFWQKPVGSGPFRIEEVQMNDFTTLVPFEEYHKGAPRIERIVALPSFDGDPNLVRNATAGRVDYAYTKNTADVEPLEELENIDVTPVNINYTRMFWINEFPQG